MFAARTVTTTAVGSGPESAAAVLPRAHQAPLCDCGGTRCPMRRCGGLTKLSPSCRGGSCRRTTETLRDVQEANRWGRRGAGPSDPMGDREGRSAILICYLKGNVQCTTQPWLCRSVVIHVSRHALCPLRIGGSFVCPGVPHWAGVIPITLSMARYRSGLTSIGIATAFLAFRPLQLCCSAPWIMP